MAKRLKKLLACVLALSLVMSTVCMTALADEGDTTEQEPEVTEVIDTFEKLENAVNDAQPGDTITVNGTIYVPRSINLIGSDKDVTIKGGTLIRDVSNTGRIFVVKNGAKLKLVNMVVDGNKNADFAKGTDYMLFMNDDSYKANGNTTETTVELVNTTLQNNKGGYGGAVYGIGHFTMTDSVITGCESGSHGGAVYINGGSFTMNGGEIHDNVSPNHGGGLCCSAPSVVNGGKIYNNVAAKDGGGVWVNTSFTFTLIDGEIYGNTAGEAGGGVACWYRGSFIMENGSVHDNVSTSGMGNALGLRLGGAKDGIIGRFSMTGGSIDGAANNDGSAIYAEISVGGTNFEGFEMIPGQTIVTKPGDIIDFLTAPAGYIINKAEEVGEKETVYTYSALVCGHENETREVTTPADYGVEGVMTYTCTVCGATRTEVIPALVRPPVVSEIVVTPAPVESQEPAPVESEEPTPVESQEPAPVESQPDEEIGETVLPQGDVPQTGDALGLWLVMAAVSGAGLVGLTAGTRKRKEN